MPPLRSWRDRMKNRRQFITLIAALALQSATPLCR
jgi:hypothetical protein